MTEIIFILDKSGSMSGLEEDTIGGFNSMLAKQKKNEDKALISTVLFDTECRVLHDRVPLQDVKPLTEKDYTAGGCTALLDAVGGALHHIGNVHKYARLEDRPEKTLVIITTDGLENSSRRYGYAKVQSMVKRQKEKYGWEFIFLGANIDAAKEARRFGMVAEEAADYCPDGAGTAVIYEAMDKAICCIRANKSCGTGWRNKLDADFQKRSKKK